MQLSPLAALFAVMVLGVTIEAIERQNKQAAYVLMVVLLLGVITFNAKAFQGQVNAIIGALLPKSYPKAKKSSPPATATPFGRKQ